MLVPGRTFRIEAEVVGVEGDLVTKISERAFCVPMVSSTQYITLLTSVETSIVAVVSPVLQSREPLLWCAVSVAFL